MPFKQIAAGLLSAGVLLTASAYAKPDKGHEDLPPGLAKKAAQGKPLPPGWQKKLRKGDVLARDIYDQGRVVVPLAKDGIVTIKVDGTLVKLYDKSRRIVDIINE